MQPADKKAAAPARKKKGTPTAESQEESAPTSAEDTQTDTQLTDVVMEDTQVDSQAGGDTQVDDEPTQVDDTQMDDEVRVKTVYGSSQSLTYTPSARSRLSGQTRQNLRRGNSTLRRSDVADA